MGYEEEPLHREQVAFTPCRVNERGRTCVHTSVLPGNPRLAVFGALLISSVFENSLQIASKFISFLLKEQNLTAWLQL